MGSKKKRDVLMEEIRREIEMGCNERRKRGRPRKKKQVEELKEPREMEFHQKRRRGRPRKNPVEEAKEESSHVAAAENGRNTEAFLHESQLKLPVTSFQGTSSAYLPPGFLLNHQTQSTKASPDRCAEMSASLRPPVQTVLCLRTDIVPHVNEQHLVPEAIGPREEFPSNHPLQAKKKGCDIEQNETAQESRTTSLDLTQMEGLIGDDFQDDDDVESRHCDGYVGVEGYLVKDDMAPILEKIIRKHGDIAEKNPSRSAKYRASLLDSVCRICQKLEASNILQIAIDELICMVEQVKHFESENLEVGWLKCRLDEILETRRFLRGLRKVKASVKSCSETLEGYKKEMEAVVIRIQEGEEALARAKLEEQRMKEDFVPLEPKMKGFIKNLAHELL